jgi:catechol 2,3-dioxygenase-like lactoylglutathione lyase family enzyme
MKLDHVNIKTTPELMERCREFYCDILGLEEGPRPAFGDPGHWLYAGEEAIVHLMLGDRTGKGAVDHFALRVDDLAPYIERLQKAGVEYKASTVPGNGLRQLFCLDPAGSGVELNCPQQ